MRIAGLLLAGGLGSRMGGATPKPMLALGSQTLAEHALSRLRGRVAPIFVSANDPAAFAALGFPVIADLDAGRRGPAAGLAALAALLSASAVAIDAVLVVAGDTPFLPADTAERLTADYRGSTVRIASYAGRLHPTVSLWPRAALVTLGAELADPAARLSLLFHAERAGLEAIAFPADPRAPGGDPFFNVNTPQDLEMARLHSYSVNLSREGSCHSR